MKKRARIAACILAAGVLLSGCGEKAAGNQEETPKSQSKIRLPEKLKLNDAGVPVLRVWDADAEENRKMDIESYLRGVLAGEMKNDWPLEALKAQAILARTFVLKFCSEKESKYMGADISTDIEEAQAYDMTGVNDRIEQAVWETRGLVLAYRGELPYAWFHAHSGGMTEKAKPGLNYEKDEPGYTKATEGRESEKAPDSAKAWQAAFSKQEIAAAALQAGADGIGEVQTVQTGETGESGRAVTLLINGRSVNAPEMRLALGSTKMRSTLLTDIKVTEDQVIFSGKGYGHGVGMPQWGAYGMAEEGKTAQEIVAYYFDGVTVEKAW
ncbi:MAG: SpoIID/LytB domain-containing protein [Clostridia bacterium]|nr:SpoIID/LytB domain-containing protein [Clostridia bacterium]